MKTPFAVTLVPATSLANHTGAWRTRRPEYVDRLPPCNAACPAGENIQGWLAPAEEGDYRAAWEALLEDNPLPAIMGRACYHSCETSCLRGKLDEPVSVHAVERFLGDLALRERWPAKAPASPSGKRVLVVGSGPSGLSAAYHLARLGHRVTIREAAKKAGGMMRYGIPRYRLPRDIVDAEIRRILDLGVEILLESPVPDIAESFHGGGFDACFMAIGAGIAERIEIPGGDAAHVLDAIALLRQVEEGEPIRIGRRVVVLGGGNTALDAARTVKRLGAEEACVVYRRTREKMPAHDSEVREALDEGIEIRWLETATRADVGALVVERMEMDAQGRLSATGQLETIGADSVVLAIGQSVDLSAVASAEGVKVDRYVALVDAHMMTGHPGLFAGGDMVPAERQISVAVGHGKRAARSIDAFVRGVAVRDQPPREIARFESINPWYYEDANQATQPTLGALRRRTTFDEIHGGLDEDNALLEARRCLSCGNCMECDNCFGVCPDNAVIKLGPGMRYRIDLDFCKGCGMCATECPCGAIRMVPEDA